MSGLWDWDQDELTDVFGEDHVEETAERTFKITDPIHGDFVLNLQDENPLPELETYESAGLIFKNIAEFYLTNPSAEYPDITIGAVRASVTAGSKLLYLVVGIESENIGQGYELKEWPVVRLEGVTPTTALDLLDAAIFKWGVNEVEGPEWPTAGTEREEHFSDLHSPDVLAALKAGSPKYFHPINAFNTGKRATNKHETFLQYYKVLEFFWGEVVNQRLLTLRTDATSSDQYLKEVKHLASAKELDSLTVLLNELVTGETLKFLQNDIFDEGDLTSNELAKRIYKFRCSVVHAKEARSADIEPGERFIGEFVDQELLDAVEVLALMAIHRWGTDG